MFERLRALNPHPTTELEYSTPFELLVAVILSAQATDKSVNLATRKLFPVASTPRAILDLGVEGLSNFVRSIGLYQGKARNIIATCRILLGLMLALGNARAAARRSAASAADPASAGAAS
jgi:endonuclease-3